MAVDMREYKRLLALGTDIVCEKCGNNNFLLVYRLKKISGLVNGTGKDSTLLIPIYACSDCGNVNAEFLKALEITDDEPTTTILTPTGK